MHIHKTIPIEINVLGQKMLVSLPVVVTVPDNVNLEGTLFNPLQESLTDRKDALPPRPQEILYLLIKTKLCNKEIAQKLNITVRTVKFHCNTIYEMFGVHSRLELIDTLRGHI